MPLIWLLTNLLVIYVYSCRITALVRRFSPNARRLTGFFAGTIAMFLLFYETEYVMGPDGRTLTRFSLEAVLGGLLIMTSTICIGLSVVIGCESSESGRFQSHR